MVKVAVAGGTGQVAREIIDALVAAKKHEVTILSRKEAAMKNLPPNVSLQVVDYQDPNSLVHALRGIHTVLSFIVVHADPEGKAQKNLIDACVAAGAKRFAPSEWAGSILEGMSLHTGKERIREYLRNLNETEKVLEYTLFQPGLFLDYLASPYQTAKHVGPLTTPFDFEKCRAIIIEEEDPIFTLTTAGDLAAIVSKAIEYEGEWPEIGGISGSKVRVSQLIELGEKIRGRQFALDKVKVADLEAGVLNVSWMPAEGHHAFDQEATAAIIKTAYIGILLSAVNGAWDVSNEFNKLFPDFQFTQMEEFLERHWKGKP